MTINHKMRAPKEMATETFDPPSSAGRARRRMEDICATPEEVARYKYDPLGARANKRPGIPLEGYEDINAEYED